MEYAFSIIMFALGAGLLIYALFIRAAGFESIPKNYSVSVKDKKRYANKFALMIALLGAVPVAAGMIGLLQVWAGVIVLVGGIICVCASAGRITRISEEFTDSSEEKHDE